MDQIGSVRCHGGWQKRFTHLSASLRCKMTFSVFVPPQIDEGKSLPVLYWLSGLTCTDENFSSKAGAQRVAAELGILLVIPDTSPRGDDVPDDADGAYDFGLGAGFYLNATQAPWSKHYNMYDYVVEELPRLIEQHFSVSDKRAISGHSMGGHGALTIALKNPKKFTSVSAFAPIVNPSQVPWGMKAFSHYLGEDKHDWRQYDACYLLEHQLSKDDARDLPILIDQGTADSFLAEQLKTDMFTAACERAGINAQVRMQDGYDHSYYFISSFIEEHLRFHAKALGVS